MPTSEDLIQINQLLEENEKLKTDLGAAAEKCEAYHQRVIEVENAFKKEQGIKIRQDITVVKADFTKLEMAILFAGINVLLKTPKTPEDARFYLELHDKVQKLLDNMQEKEPKKDGM